MDTLASGTINNSNETSKSIILPSSVPLEKSIESSILGIEKSDAVAAITTFKRQETRTCTSDKSKGYIPMKTKYAREGQSSTIEGGNFEGMF